MTLSSPAYLPPSTNIPPNFPIRTVPIGGNSVLPTTVEPPNSDKLSKFGSCAMTSRTCARVIASVLTVKEVMDCGNLQSEGIRGCGVIPNPTRDTVSAFENQWVYSNRFSGTLCFPPTQTCRCLTWWAGLSSSTGNVLNHLSIFPEVKVTKRKRCRRHD